MQLRPDEALHEDLIKAQELMTMLSDAGEELSKTIFMALVLNSLPNKIGDLRSTAKFLFLNQIHRAAIQTESIEDSRKQRIAGDELQQHVAMPSSGKFQSSKTKNFGIVNKSRAGSSKKLSCYCCGKAGHIAKNFFLKKKWNVENVEQKFTLMSLVEIKSRIKVTYISATLKVYIRFS